jgi:hypothetical protein
MLATLVALKVIAENTHRGKPMLPGPGTADHGLGDACDSASARLAASTGFTR